MEPSVAVLVLAHGFAVDHSEDLRSTTIVAVTVVGVLEAGHVDVQLRQEPLDQVARVSRITRLIGEHLQGPWPFAVGRG